MNFKETRVGIDWILCRLILILVSPQTLHYDMINYMLTGKMRPILLKISIEGQNKP